MKTILNYTGKIKIFINLNNKTFEISAHNSGTATLYESICRFLAGQYRGNCDIPSYLDIRDNNNVTVLINKIPLSGRSFISNDSEIYTRCEATILFESLFEGIVAQEGVNYKLVLCADKDPNITGGQYRDLAYALIPSASLSRITAGTSATIEWRMYISDGGE